LIATKGIETDTIKNILRGEEGSKVELLLLRKNKLITIRTTRTSIPIHSIDVAYMLEPSIGYIKLNTFSATTYQEFMAASKKLNQQGMTRLILDLRDNGGGRMDAAVALVDEILEGDRLIVYSEGKNYQRKEERCKKPGLLEKTKITVLVNNNSASASEIVAAAVQEWDRGLIIGDRTFGKGLVQESFELSDGGELRLTVARYYTPLGRNLQKSYKKNTTSNSGKDVEIKPAAADTFYTTKAGKKLYANGGVHPDVYIDFDKGDSINLKIDNAERRIFIELVYQYYTQNLQLFNAYKTPTDLYTQFKIPASLVQQAADHYAGYEDSKKNSVAIKTKVNEILMALFAKQIWRTPGYLEIANKNDFAVRKAIEISKR
jgi:carboxyl-terminal processing protease